jgi:hypothetical protein
MQEHEKNELWFSHIIKVLAQDKPIVLSFRNTSRFCTEGDEIVYQTVSISALPDRPLKGLKNTSRKIVLSQMSKTWRQIRLMMLNRTNDLESDGNMFVRKHMTR